jgi:UDPglucose 6-dehydrogenase
MKRKVAVAGLWHLGTVASACFAKLGHEVTAWDGDPRRVAGLQDGRSPIFEPGLEALVREFLSAGRLRFTSDLASAVEGCDAIVIAYDTPVTERDEVDLSTVLKTVEEVIPALRPGAVVVVHSQVPVGTCDAIRAMVRNRHRRESCDVAYLPENLRLGEAIERFLHPDVLVVGAEDPRTHEAVDDVFTMEGPRVRTSLASAEMVKHGINAFLATAISLGNELANLCQLVGADATEVVAALRLDPRIGSHAPLAPGLGFAGGTLARDVQILRRLGRDHGAPARLMEAVLAVNDEQNRLPVRWLRDLFGSPRDLRVAVLGLTYKAGTSTLRRSSALETVRLLLSEGATVAATDPKADLSEIADAPALDFTRDAYAAVVGADALLLMTPWPEFSTLDYARILPSMRHPVILDMPNALDREAIERLGYTYLGVGRGRVKPLSDLAV